MSAGRLLKIADAVVSALNLPEAPQAGVAFERVLDTEIELEDMEILHAQVVPGGVDSEIGTQQLMRGEHVVDIALRKKMNTDDREAVDAMFHLLGAIDLYLFGLKRLPALAEAAWLKSKVRYPYVPEKLRQREYWGLLTVTYLAYGE
jgi:hypothetical protein